ncbi:hypothetical protein SMIR_41630 (plasmid) [Streptomyces mirabilis]|nr:hypothetical protein SMIR_41630 [Streptomyces mirabilis]
MSGVIATVSVVLIVAGTIYDTVRLLTPAERRCPPLARLRGRRAALEAAECRLAGLRLRGRIDAADYRRRMTGLAHGRRTAPADPKPTRRM